VALAAAAALAVAYVGGWRPGPGGAGVLAGPAAAVPRSLNLSDGTVVRLNVGGEVRERFTPEERTVDLVRGEAHFAVVKNPARPFVVHAGPARVRAVGTAFNVNLRAEAVEILVTEGRVKVTPPAESGAPAAATDESAAPLVDSGQRALVARSRPADGPGVVVSNVSRAELARALAWQGPLLRLGGATLAELAAEFEARTGRRLVLADPALAGLRIGGRFPGDDLEGFVRLLEEHYGVRSHVAPDGAIVLSREP